MMLPCDQILGTCLQVLSRMCSQPITVYIPESEVRFPKLPYTLQLVFSVGSQLHAASRLVLLYVNLDPRIQDKQCGILIENL
jgi:hypothetical protein